MLVKPTVPELLKKTKKNRYSLVVATAKRARQIAKGSKAMTQEDDISPITLAADEIGEGKLKIYDEAQWEEEEKLRKENENDEQKVEEDQEKSED